MSSNGTLDRYDTWIDEEDYKTGSTIAVKVCYRGDMRIRFLIDHGLSGSDRSVSLIKKYTNAGMTQSEAYSLSTGADKVEETNKVARRMIQQATKDQSDVERASYPIRAYVERKVFGDTVWVDVTEPPEES
jgi:hypothetical protein